jgi:hypothetical protein
MYNKYTINIIRRLELLLHDPSCFNTVVYLIARSLTGKY